MAQTSRPDPASGSVVADYEYEQLGRLFATDALYGNPSNSAAVYADSTGRQVKLRSGISGLVRGYLWMSDTVSDEIIGSLPANTSGNPRIDRLVLRLTRSTRQVRTLFVQGTASATPVAPALTQDLSVTTGVWDFPLARWQVPAGYTTIAAGDIVTEAWYMTNPGQILCRTNSRPQGAVLKDGTQVFNYDILQPERYLGGNWLTSWNQPVTVAQLTNKTVTSNTTPQSTDLTLAVAANGQYTVKALLFYTAGQTGDMAVGLDTPAGASFRIVPRGLPSTHGGGESGSFFVGGHNSSPVGIFGGSDGGETLSGELEGLINIGSTAGNLAVTITQSAGSSTSTVLLQKSFLTLTRFA